MKAREKLPSKRPTLLGLTVTFQEFCLSYKLSFLYVHNLGTATSKDIFQRSFLFVVVSDLYATVILILGQFHQLNVISAWETKTGLLILALLHRDQRTNALKEYIIFSICACTSKQLEQFFKQMQNQSLKTLRIVALLCHVS